MPPSIAILDTNILLLWLVAETDVSLLRTFKRIQNFEDSDIPLLEKLLASYQHLICTPHVLAEVSNFVDQAPPYRRLELIASFKRFIREHEERFEESRKLALLEEFDTLGLADTGLSSLSTEVVVITTDFRLAGKIASTGREVVNFSHLRTSNLLGNA